MSRGFLPKLCMMISLRHAGLLAVTVYLVASGCGNLPAIPTIDEVRTVPDNSQSHVLAQTQFSPQEGPVGTLITIFGRGDTFPAGIVNMTFSGTGRVEFDLPAESSEIKVRVPFGTISGPFGFTISGRRAIALDNALPSSNVFEAWRFEAPGFRVTTPNGVPGDLTQPFPNESSGQSQHPPPNSGNQPSQNDIH